MAARVLDPSPVPSQAVPLEPRLRPLLWAANRLPDDPDQPMQARRASSDATERYLGRLVLRPGAEVASVSEHPVPVAGGTIRVRLYRPSGDGAQPVHVFMHGGGWCAGTLDGRDNRCRDLAAGAGCTVASVEYRLAPENRYPTAPEDCYRALCWLVANAADLGLDPSRITVGGESAGANLAAVVCLMARDRGGPMPLLQVLDVPATDLTLSQPSIDRLGHGYLLTRPDMDRYVAHYLADPAQVREAYASPLHAPDLSGLPPAMITTCEFDPLRDDGEAYAGRLRGVGVEVHHRVLAGHIHSSFAFTRLLPSAREHDRACIDALRRAFGAA